MSRRGFTSSVKGAGNRGTRSKELIACLNDATVESLFVRRGYVQYLPTSGHGLLFTLNFESRVTSASLASAVQSESSDNKKKKDWKQLEAVLCQFVFGCSVDICGDAPWVVVPRGFTTFAKLSVFPLDLRKCFSTLNVDHVSVDKSSDDGARCCVEFSLRLVVGCHTKTSFAFKHQTIQWYLSSMCSDSTASKPFSVDVKRRVRGSKSGTTKLVTICSVVTDAQSLLLSLESNGTKEFTTESHQEAARTTAGRDAIVKVTRRSTLSNVVDVVRWLFFPFLFASLIATMHIAEWKVGDPSAVKSFTERFIFKAPAPMIPPLITTESPVDNECIQFIPKIYSMAQAWKLGTLEQQLIDCEQQNDMNCINNVLESAAKELGVDSVNATVIHGLQAALNVSESSGFLSLPFVDESSAVFLSQSIHTLKSPLALFVVVVVFLVLLITGTLERCCMPARRRAGHALKAIWRIIRPAVLFAHSYSFFELLAYLIPLDLVVAGSHHESQVLGTLVVTFGLVLACCSFFYSTFLHGCSPPVLKCISHGWELRAVFFVWLFFCCLPWALVTHSLHYCCLASLSFGAALISLFSAQPLRIALF